MSTSDDTTTTDVLATPDEQLQAAIEMDKIREYTVRPGLLRLPVSELTTAANHPAYLLQLSHPVIEDDELRFFIDKPAYWDPTAFLWPRFLDWYGYTTRSQYELQTDRVYVRYNRRADEWELTKPPSDRRRQWWRYRDALAAEYPRAARVVRGAVAPFQRARPGLATPVRTGVCVGVGVVAYAVTYPWALSLPATGTGLVGIATAIALALSVWFLAMMAAALAIEPPREGDT